MDAHIIIDGVTYELVTAQRNGESYVYRGTESYVRIGRPQWIGELMNRHALLAQAGFPVPRVLAEGDYGDLRYYREQSLGRDKLGTLFKEEWSRGEITDASFDAFLQVAREFTCAQIAAGALLGTTDELAKGIHLDLLLGDMEDDAEALRAAFEAISARLSALPIVACHGDLNPQNMFPDGVIDFEDMFSGPLGYDQISALATTELNPEGRDHEFPARYRFTEAQKKAYFDTLDPLFVAVALPPLSTFRNDFEFCRAVWAATHMEEWPKTRAWRHERIRTLLDDKLMA